MSIRLKLTIMFLAIASIPLLLVSALTFTNYKNSLETNHISQLRDLTIFRADKIETYFAGLKANIEVAQGYYNIKTNLPLMARLASDSNNPEFLAAKKMLNEQLGQMQSVLSDLSDIMLVNPQGKVVYANKPEHYYKDLSNGYDAEQKAFAEGKDRIYYSDIYYDKAEDNRFEILLTAPAYDFNDGFIGVIAFEIDMTPAYKLIQDVTGLGNTGEVLIGKKIGNEVEFLNPLRHAPQAALKIKVTLGDASAFPIQQAVQGRTGSGLSTDYRGKKVIAAWRYIPSLDWGMVAKIDTQEAFADVTNLRNLSIVILLVVIVLSGIMAFSIAQSISEPIKRLSKGAEIIGSGNLDYKIGTNLKDEIGQLSRSFDKMTYDLKQTTASRDELNREITERKKKEQELYKLNRTLRALSNSIQAMMQATDESEYLKEVCNSVVRDCGHVMAWIGFAEDDENKTVRPVANAGFEQGYLETLNITWADTERGHGPTGMAIRTGKLSMCRNMLTDPAFAPWRQEAIKRGYASSIVLPLISDGKTFGALTIYSREPDPFSDDEVKLLTELADDLAYGIAAIRLRIAHTQAEEAVRKSRDELEVRVEERTAQLSHTVETLQDEVTRRTLAEEALRMASLYTRGLIEASLDPLVTISPEGKITDVNKATELITGAAREQLIGTDFSDYFIEPEKARKGYKQVFAEGFVTDYPLTIHHRDGMLTDVLYNATVYKDTNGNVIGVFAAARDVTERKAAQERENVTNSLLHMFAEKVSRKAYLDSTVERIHNWSGCEFIGIRIRDAEGNIPYESYVGFDKDFLALENALHLGRDKCICIRSILENPQQQEQKFMTGDGSFYCNDSLAFLNRLSEQQKKEYRANCMKRGFQSIAVIPIRYHEQVIGAIHITDFKKGMVPLSKIQFIETSISPLIGEAVQRFTAEAELEKHRLHLEELVKQRTEELTRSNKELEQFAYVASHDLQEPLRMIAGYTQLLQRRYKDKLDEDANQFIFYTVDGVLRMQTLINDLLTYSRLEIRGKVFESVDCQAIFDDVLVTLQMTIEESGAIITHGPLPTVQADRIQLFQLFQNLIGNAIKFRGDKPPLIHIEAKPQQKRWLFSVRDNGIGIEPQYMERIFVIFQRLHSRDKYPGTGIGLAICKKIVERHGGRIWVESQPGNGSTFYFII
jgi:PAS domain S-box-containing protein